MPTFSDERELNVFLYHSYRAFLSSDRQIKNWPRDIRNSEYQPLRTDSGLISFLYISRGPLYVAKRVEMKPGRFLTQHFPFLSQENVRALVNTYELETNPPKLFFARTREEIKAAYRAGPSSCMSYALRRYHTLGIHPTEAYASGDYAIAYLLHSPNDLKSMYARKVVSERHKEQAPKGYGNNHLLTQLLDQMGYTSQSSKKTDRLLNIYHPTDHSYRIVPYMDGKCGVEISKTDGEFLDITPSGNSRVQNTAGILYVLPNKSCTRCGNMYPITYLSPDLRGYCQECNSTCSICYQETPTISRYHTVPLEHLLATHQLHEVADKYPNLVGVAACSACSKKHGGSKIV